MRTGLGGKKGRGGSGTKIIAGLLAIAATFAIIFGGLSFYETFQKKKHPETEGSSMRWIDDNTVYIDSELYGFDHRMETYLFIGTDNSGNLVTYKGLETDADSTGADSEARGEENYQGGMADYLLLLVMDHTTDTYGAIAIDRNTITEVDMLDENGELFGVKDMQICTSHWYGRDGEESAENTAKAVRNLLGELEYIDGYFVRNMQEIELLNHTVGGVTLTIEDDMENVDPAFVKGSTITLTDEQAEKYLRARMAVGEGDNASRMRRQQTYMESFFIKAAQNVNSDPAYAQKFWNTLREAGVTDMTGNDASRIGEKMRSGKSKGILHIEGETKIGTVLNDGLEHEEFYPDPASIYHVMNDLFSLVHIVDEEDESEEAELMLLEDESDFEDESDWEDESDFEDESDREDESGETVYEN